MKKTALLLLLLAFPLWCAPAQQGSQAKKHRPWWNDEIVQIPVDTARAKQLPLIQVRGNRFVSDRGDTVVFRGLAIADPDKIEAQGRWGKNLFVKMKEMGAAIVRIPVHPAAWRERAPAKYCAMLDQAVEWCTSLGMYVMIDWHTIGNLEMELFQDPYYNTTRRETYEFWRTIARHFQGHHTVVFYEIFNEPTVFKGQLGRMSWGGWKKINEDIISLIRAYDTEKIPLVAGLDWAYDLTPLHNEPIEAEGIGYVTHPYAHKRPPPYEAKWEEDFGFAAARYPVVATEFGFIEGKQGIADNGAYGKAIIDYLEAKGMSWMGWIFDPDWNPRMFESWETYTLTEGGAFFKKAMQGKSAGQAR